MKVQKHFISEFKKKERSQKETKMWKQDGWHFRKTILHQQSLQLNILFHPLRTTRPRPVLRSGCSKIRTIRVVHWSGLIIVLKLICSIFSENGSYRELLFNRRRCLSHVISSVGDCFQLPIAVFLTPTDVFFDHFHVFHWDVLIDYGKI